MIPAFEHKLAALGNPNEWHQKLVFIDHVVRVDEKQSVLIRPSALIRLHVLNHCRRPLTNPILDFLFAPFERSAITQNREADGRIGDAVGVVQQGQLPEKMIEGGPHIVNAIADEEGPLSQRWLPMELEAHNMYPHFGIQFFNNRIGISIENKGVNGTLEYAKVLFCPRDLGLATV